MALLVLAYVFAWSPARDVLMIHGASPVVEAACSTGTCEQVRTSQHAVTVKATADGPWVSIDPPAGVRFLLPALFILAIAPRSPYWLYFFGGHVTLTVLTLLLVYLGVAAGPLSVLYIARFISSYLLDAYSLAVPALLLARRTLGSKSA